MKDKATILLVDDKEMALAVGQAMIARLGHDVLTAISGREAIEKYQENQDRIDLVILDVVMPEMDGADTYEKLRKINPDVKAILSTGYQIGQDKNRRTAEYRSEKDCLTSLKNFCCSKFLVRYCPPDSPPCGRVPSFDIQHIKEVKQAESCSKRAGIKVW